MLSLDLEMEELQTYGLFGVLLDRGVFPFALKTTEGEAPRAVQVPVPRTAKPKCVGIWLKQCN